MRELVEDASTKQRITDSHVQKVIRSSKRRKVWTRAVAVAVAIIIALTGTGMTMPANTATAEIICG